MYLNFKVKIMSENCILILFLFLRFEFVGTTGSGECDPLTFDGPITCENSRSTSTLTNDCGESQPVGTTAKYKCKAHYVMLRNRDALLNSENNNVLQCSENGSWIGYERFNSVICQEECGRRLTNPKPLIVHGKSTNSSTWPWHVALFRRRGSEFDYICGGTIISRSTIITVAHCVTDLNGQKLLPNTTLVVLGATTSNFTQNRLKLDAQIIEINKIYVSENYDVKKDFQADIAILHLSKHIEYTDHVSPICLPNDFAVDTNTIRPGTLGDVVGFGIDENGEIAQNLKHGVLEIKSQTECFVSLDRIISESQLCAGSPQGKVATFFNSDNANVTTVCNGDSGGGLIRPSLIDQKYYIHGLVSSGDPNPMKRICQSHAVFTRVYTFIFWIRGILMDLKDNVLHLGTSNAFLHRQSGTEEEHGRFIPIYQEWRNKVTAIELSYMDIDPEILFRSLDYSKRVQSINFTHVMFTQQFPEQRVLLPFLKTFSLNILRPDFVLTEEFRFPITLSKELLRSLVFFVKNVEDGNLDIVRMIPTLKTNLDITVHIFKLLRIHHEKGNFMISQIPFSNELLENISPDFRLRYLALSKINLSSSVLTRLIRNVETLVLDEVTGIDAHEFSQNLKPMTQLTEFVFISPISNTFSKFKISFNSLPKSLKHLALTRAVITIDPIQHLENYILNNLETFYCDSCLPPEISNSVQVLSDIFPKLRRLVLRIDSNPNNSLITTTLKDFKNLEFALVKSGAGFINLFRKKSDIWHVQSLQNSLEFSHLEFVFNRRRNFWSSEAEYMVGKRLSSFENFGFTSRNYEFNGGNKERRDFPVIPRQIQERLHTIQIRNTYITTIVIRETLKYAKDLRRLRITNVTVFDVLIGKLVELPDLIEYTLEMDRTTGSMTLNFKELATLLSNLFPNLIPFRQEIGINLKKNLLSGKVSKYHIVYGECVMVSWDKVEGSLISSLVYTNDWLKHSANESIPIKKLVFQYWELDPTSLPSTISQLNLNFAIVKDVGMILRRLSQLSHLKLINVRVNDDGDFKDWDWTQVDMQDLSKRSETLEYLAIEKAHLRNYSPGMTFHKIEFIYMESCTFEKSFVRNFMSTFPNLKRLVILGVGDPIMEIYLDVIILGALRSNTVEWILMSNNVLGSSTNRARKEINVILDQSGINRNGDDLKYFILERTSSSEAWSRNSSLDESMIELELLELKGVTYIGINPQCHPSSYRVEKNTTDIPGQLLSVVYEDFYSTAT